MESRRQAGEQQSQSFQDYLLETFGTSSQIYDEVVPFLFDRLVEADGDSRLSKHFEFWRESVDINIEAIRSDIESTISTLEGTRNGDDRAAAFLYSLQSYYALVVNADRLLSIRYLSAETAQQRDYTDLSEEYANLLEQPEDKPFAPWLESLGTGQEPFDRITRAMSESPARVCGEDGFKDLYQDIIGNPFRKAMGEFYTRAWLADLIMTEIGYDGSSVLDPACGSGAFLVKAAEEVLSEDDITGLSRITGFDLNPVAVAATKSNVLGSAVACADSGALSASELRELELPIYWTNSILWSEPDLHGNNMTVLSPVTELQFPRDPAEAVETVRTELEAWSGAHSFEGILGPAWFEAAAESFTAPLGEGPFEFVVGNPPWVSPERMSKDYRDRVTELLEESGFLDPFQPEYLTNRFPNTQFVAALPFYEVSMNYYMGNEGTCAYLVTSSLLKSMNGGGFREQMQERNMTQLLDFTAYTDIHQGATSWGCVPVIDRGSDDGSSVEYEYFTPTDGTMPPHEGDCENIHTPEGEFHVCSWELPREELPFVSEDAKSPWFTAPPAIVEIYRKMLDGTPYVGENYRITRGMVTGRNSVYVVTDIEGEGDSIRIRTGASERPVEVESELVYPFVEGKNLSAWQFGYRYLLLPYNVPEWTPIDEASLDAEFPKASAYFESNRDALTSRRTHTIASQMERGDPYYVVESRDILGETAVVGIREVAPYVETAVIPASIDEDTLGQRSSIVAHTLNFVVPDSDREAYFLAGICNSWPVRALLYDVAQPKGGRPGKRFDMYLISSIPVPEFDRSDPSHQKVVELAETAHRLAEDQDELNAVQAELNEVVAEEIYSITRDELESLRTHYDRLSHTPE